MMKKLICMAAVCLVAVFCATSVAAQGQSAEQKAIEKNLKKEIKIQADSIQHLKVLDAINDRYFIIPVSDVSFLGGRNFHSLNTSTNYIVVQNDGAIVQTSLSLSHLGPNGLGGVTLSGRVGDITTVIDKKGDVSVSFHVNGIGSNVDVQISIPKNSTHATAYVTPSLSGGSMTMRGEIIPFRDDSLRIDK